MRQFCKFVNKILQFYFSFLQILFFNLRELNLIFPFLPRFSAILPPNKIHRK